MKYAGLADEPKRIKQERGNPSDFRVMQQSDGYVLPIGWCNVIASTRNFIKRISVMDLSIFGLQSNTKFFRRIWVVYSGALGDIT